MQLDQAAPRKIRYPGLTIIPDCSRRCFANNLHELRQESALREMKCVPRDEANEAARDLHGRT
jgi:hypothetical protein